MRGLSLLVFALLPACAASSSTSPASTGPVSAEPVVRRVEYRGTVDLEAHLANPGDTVPLALAWAQTCEGDTCLVERTTGEGEQANTVRIWSTAEATWFEGAEVRMPDADASTHRRVLELFAARGDGSRARIEVAHPRLGDVVDVADYGAMAPDGVPESVSLDVHDTDVSWRGTLELHAVTPAAALQTPDVPPAADVESPSIEQLADRLWDVRVPAQDARSFVVEFDTFCAVLEAPWSSPVGEQVVDLIEEALPKKPIRYVLYSHHHPHYTGGLRAFMASGATVVAPTVHRDFVASIADREFSRIPDRWSRTGTAASVITFEGDFTIAEGGRSLQVIDIGERSNHTTAYMVAWLPDSRTLVQGDIGWFAGPSGDVRVGSRSAGLLRAVDERGLDVRTLVQAWPVNSQTPTLEMRRFRAAVEGGAATEAR